MTTKILPQEYVKRTDRPLQEAAAEMRAYHQATGAYRIDHLREVLGDQKTHVSINVSKGRAAASISVE